MRIVHLHRFEGETGGGGVYVSELLRAQAARGLEVRLLRVGAGQDIAASAGVVSGLRGCGRTLSRLSLEQPDVVHMHGVYGLISPWVLRQIRGRWPTALTVHHVSPICFRDSKVRRRDGALCDRALGPGCIASRCHQPVRDGGWMGPYDAAVRLWQVAEYRRLDSVIVSSGYLEAEMLRNGFTPEKLVRLPLFSRWRPEEAPAPSASRRILFVGRLSPEKGAHVLIAALAGLRSPDWSAVIAGDGPQAAELQAQVARAGLGGQVELPGALRSEALPDLYRGSRLVVVPSIGPEAFSLAGVEAMSFGRPVVAAAAGGVAEWLADGETGSMVPREDPQALGCAVQRLLDDPGLADRMGGAGRERAAARFGRDDHLAALERLYRRMTEKRDSRHAHHRV